MAVQRGAGIAMLVLWSFLTYAQDTSGAQRLPTVLPGYFSSVAKNSNNLQSQVQQREVKYLSRLQAIKSKILNKLSSVDPAAAQALQASSANQYQGWQKNLAGPLPINADDRYLPHLDTVSTSLAFLKQNNQYLSGTPDADTKLSAAQAATKALQSRMDQAGQFEGFVNDQQQQLQNLVNQYGLSSGLLTGVKQFQQQAYYFNQEVAGYTQLLNTPTAAEQKALSVLSQLPACQKYLQGNTMLARLFKVPDNYSSPDALDGLQTRSQLQQDIQNRMGNGPSDGQSSQFVQQQVQAAQQALAQLKSKLPLTGLSGLQGNTAMPAFTPNTQHTTSFLKRLQYGLNLQTESAGGYLPASLNLAALLGYRLSDAASIGIGANYIEGLGTGLNNISLSSQGVGWRTYFDIKAKKGIWVTGGCEYNYLYAFKTIDQLRNPNLWQKSALLGIEKKYRLPKGRENNIQLLYDFLYKQHTPQTQPLVFRVGYSF